MVVKLVHYIFWKWWAVTLRSWWHIGVIPLPCWQEAWSEAGLLSQDEKLTDSFTRGMWCFWGWLFSKICWQDFTRWRGGEDALFWEIRCCYRKSGSLALSSRQPGLLHCPGTAFYFQLRISVQCIPKCRSSTRLKLGICDLSYTTCSRDRECQTVRYDDDDDGLVLENYQNLTW